MYKSFLIVCAQALLIQSVFSACVGIGAGCGGCGINGLAGYGLGAGAGCGGVASTGGGHLVSSASCFPPVGLSIVSENVYQGTLFVNGNLPFVGTVGLEGILPTAGAGAVSYGCGNGAVGIGAEAGPIVTGIAAPGTYAPGIGGVGYGAGFGGIGYGAGCGNACGCGGFY